MLGTQKVVPRVYAVFLSDKGKHRSALTGGEFIAGSFTRRPFFPPLQCMLKVVTFAKIFFGGA